MRQSHPLRHLARSLLVLLALSSVVYAQTITDISVRSLGPANPAPTANSGSDITAEVGDRVILDGSQSSDPEQQALEYEWVQVSGAEVALEAQDTSAPSFTAPPLAAGQSEAVLEFGLSVIDSGGKRSDSDTVAVTVIPANTPPIAVAGPDQEVLSAVEVFLDGSASTDPEQAPIAFEWTQLSGPSVSLSSPSAAMPVFLSPAIEASGEPKTLVFQLTVSDPKGLKSLPSTTTVRVSPANIPPVIVMQSSIEAETGQELSIDASGSSDPNGDPLAFSWRQSSGPEISLEGSETPVLSFIAPEVEEGQTSLAMRFELVLSDDKGLSATRSIGVTVTRPNQPPVARISAPGSAASGSSVVLDGGESSDPEGLALTFSWTQTAGPTVTLSSAQERSARFTAPVRQFYQSEVELGFELTISDSEGLQASASATVLVIPEVFVPPIELPPVSTVPVANAGADVSAVPTRTATLNGSASSDPEGDVLSYKWTQTAGTAVTLSDDTLAAPSFTAPTVGSGGATSTLKFELVVTDSHGNTSAVDEVVVTVSKLVSALQSLSPITVRTAEKSILCIQSDATDSSGNTYCDNAVPEKTAAATLVITALRASPGPDPSDGQLERVSGLVDATPDSSSPSGIVERLSPEPPASISSQSITVHQLETVTHLGASQVINITLDSGTNESDSLMCHNDGVGIYRGGKTLKCTCTAAYEGSQCTEEAMIITPPPPS